MSERYDVIIVGAGMVGATLGCALAQSDFRIALIDPAPVAANLSQAQFDLRVSAITRASQRIFQSLGVWPEMERVRVSPFRQMHVWDAGGNQSIHFDAADVAEDTLGHIVENRVIQSALHQRLDAFTNADLRIPAALDELHIEDDGVRLVLADGTALRAGLVVGADGVGSAVRKLSGIATRGWRYDQCGVVAAVRPQRFHRETAWQRFLPSGPLAFLPLANGWCSIVWTNSPDQAAALVEMDEAQFRSKLESAFESRLGPILECGPRAQFPLRLQHTTEYVRPRVALLGDAAHSIHPLAGQGVNLGLLDAAALADVLEKGRSGGRDPGEFALLRRYERWRKGDNLATMAVMDGFKRLFGIRAVPIRLLRNLGLGAFDRATPLKRIIIQHAMGLSGDLPPLARNNVGVR